MKIMQVTATTRDTRTGCVQLQGEWVCVMKQPWAHSDTLWTNVQLHHPADNLHSRKICSLQHEHILKCKFSLSSIVLFIVSIVRDKKKNNKDKSNDKHMGNRECIQSEVIPWCNRRDSDKAIQSNDCIARMGGINWELCQSMPFLRK